MRTKSSPRLALLLCGSLFVSSNADTYPSAPPYENEAEPQYLKTPADVPEGTFNLAFDDNDPGGYTRDAYLNCASKWNAISGPGTFSPMMCHKMWTNSVNGKKEWDDVAASAVNCTKPCFSSEGVKTLSTSLSDLRSDNLYQYAEDWCKSGDCCEDLSSYFKPDTDTCYTPKAMTSYKQFEEALTRLGCKRGTFSQPVFCTVLTGYRFDHICSRIYLSPTKRDKMFPCLDTYMRTYLHCKLLSAPAKTTFMEPLVYFAKISQEENVIIQGWNAYPDNVCYPYSYYFPALAKSSSAASSSSTVATSATSQSVSTQSSSSTATTSSPSPSTATSAGSAIFVGPLVLSFLLVLALFL